MYTDYTKPSETIILDMINYHNRESLMANGIYPLRGSDLIIGTPVLKDNLATKVKITPKYTAPFVDSFWFHYNRVPLNNLLLYDSNTTFKVRSPGEYHLSEIIGDINSRWQINLGVRDYTDTSVVIEQYDAHIDLIADPRSLVWVGGISLRVSCGITLSDNVTVRILDGFSELDLAGRIPNRLLDGFTPAVT